MGNLKKAIAKDLQQNGTTDWAARLSKVVKGFNNTAYQSLLNETPDEVYHKGEPTHNNTEFEMREQMGRQMAAQTTLPNTHKGTWRSNGAFREYIGRPDARKRGDRPNYSGVVKLVDSVHGNTVKATDGTTHSLTTIRPVDKDSQSTTIGLRLVGSEQTENAQRQRLQTFADALAEILASKPRGMSTGDAATALRANMPGFKKRIGTHDVHAVHKAVPRIRNSNRGCGWD